MRSRKIIINAAVGLIYEFIFIISGFVIPNLILKSYGSSVYGLISSVAQFLSIIALLRAGVGGVTKAALYKPLADGDLISTSRILSATKKFMQKIAWIFAGIVCIFAFAYYFFIDAEFSWIYCFILVLILGLGTFIQYYFGIAYQLLLESDQKSYVWNSSLAVSTIVNIVLTIFLIKLNMTIQVVKLSTALTYALPPLLVHRYVKCNYKLNTRVEPNYNAIKQRWDAFGHQIANYVHSSTDIVLLTLFSNLKEVSVYAIYSMIINGCIRVSIETAFGGFDSALGNMIAKSENDTLDRSLTLFEYLIFFLSTIMFSCTIILMPSFIGIYTAGITDVNYQRPVFLYIFTIAEYIYCLRIPYYAVMSAAGHYKQTKIYAILEAAINLTVSILLVPKYGMIGVVIGTLSAMSYRTLQLIIYDNKHIIKRKLSVLLRFAIASLIGGTLTIFITSKLSLIKVNNYFDWFIYAVVVFAGASIINITVNIIICKKETMSFIGKCISIIKPKSI